MRRCNSWFRKWYGPLALLCLFTACDRHDVCDDLKEAIYEKRRLLDILTRAAPAISGANAGAAVAELAPAAAAAASSTAPKERCVLLRAKAGVEVSHLTFPNKSYGQFIARVSVMAPSVEGLVDGQSLAFLEFRQAEAAGGPRRFYVAAVYDKAADGLRAFVADPENPGILGVPRVFPGKYQIDLEIQQTNDLLVLLARETTADHAAPTFIPLLVLNLPLDPAFFRLYVGVRGLGPKGTFGFNHFAIDGDAMGGTLEYPVIAKIRDAMDAVRLAQAKIGAGEWTAGVAALDDALEKNEEAVVAIETQRDAFQRTTNSRLASIFLSQSRIHLARSIAAVESRNSVRARTYLPLLDTVATRQTQAMGSMLGFFVPRLTLDSALFTPRVPLRLTQPEP